MSISYLKCIFSSSCSLQLQSHHSNLSHHHFFITCSDWHNTHPWIHSCSPPNHFLIPVRNHTSKLKALPSSFSNQSMVSSWSSGKDGILRHLCINSPRFLRSCSTSLLAVAFSQLFLSTYSSLWLTTYPQPFTRLTPTHSLDFAYRSLPQRRLPWPHFPSTLETFSIILS